MKIQTELSCLYDVRRWRSGFREPKVDNILGKEKGRGESLTDICRGLPWFLLLIICKRTTKAKERIIGKVQAKLPSEKIRGEKEWLPLGARVGRIPHTQSIHYIRVLRRILPQE